MDQWIKATKHITVNAVELDINSICSRLDDGITPECSDDHTPATKTNCLKYQLGIGIPLGLLLIIILVLVGLLYVLQMHSHTDNLTLDG